MFAFFLSLWSPQVLEQQQQQQVALVTSFQRVFESLLQRHEQSLNHLLRERPAT